jgi:hypothetical protein
VHRVVAAIAATQTNLRPAAFFDENGSGMSVTAQLPNRREILTEVRRSGYRPVAVLPYHYPRALLRAHGFHPVELWGPPDVPRDEGSRHFQPYTCDIVVRATSFLLRGGLDGVDALLVPHTCDALQGMGSVVGDFGPVAPPVLALLTWGYANRPVLPLQGRGHGGSPPGEAGGPSSTGPSCQTS